MEDIIYFLLLIGWVVFSFYQQNEKKKRKKAQMEAARPQEQSDTEQYGEMTEEDQENDSDSGFKRIFEGLLSEEDDNEAEIEVAGEKNFRTQDREEKKNIYQRFLEDDLAEEKTRQDERNKLESQKKLEKKIEALEKDMVLHEEVEEEVSNQNVSWFNLRDAVIYSEILSRKY
jgi:hypothetical protein